MTTSRRLPESMRSALIASNPSIYICKSCRSQLSRVNRSNIQQLRYASQRELPFTEKLRRKIWGTDNPPGLADPYGGPSFLERARMRNQQKEKLPYEEVYNDENNTELESYEDVADEELTGTSHAKPAVIEEYAPAETWDGLQHVGHKGHWRDLPPRPKDVYKPWIDADPQQVSSRAELISHLHQAIVEYLRTSDKSQSSQEEQKQEVSSESIEQTIPSKIVLSQNGKLSHLEDAQPHENTLPNAEPAVSHQIMPDETFLSAKLDFTDPITFTILKRFSQLSRQRIPDPVLNAMQEVDPTKNLQYLINQILQPVRSKAKPLSETLMKKKKLVSQSNVMILPRRETPVDREKEVGRWKVIEKELKSRGLPVLGRVAA